MEERYDAIADEKTVEATIKNLEERGIEAKVAENKSQALEEIKRLIPAGASVMNGSSTTLQEIGFVDFLRGGKHGWKNLHEHVLAEKDWGKQAELRRQALLADYFLASVNAIAESGELVATDNSGSRVGAFPYAAKHLILVASTNKIRPSLQEALRRVWEYVIQLEDERMMKAYGMHTELGKTVILHRERIPGRIKVILVKEKLGF